MGSNTHLGAKQRKIRRQNNLKWSLDKIGKKHNKVVGEGRRKQKIVIKSAVLAIGWHQMLWKKMTNH